jgi:hypothetical protein
MKAPLLSTGNDEIRLSRSLFDRSSVLDSGSRRVPSVAPLKRSRSVPPDWLPFRSPKPLRGHRSDVAVISERRGPADEMSRGMIVERLDVSLVGGRAASPSTAAWVGSARRAGAARGFSDLEPVRSK